MAILYVIATPVGNMEDITLRALRVLGHVQALGCEDTRRTGRLLAHHGITRPPLIFSYHEHNEDRVTGRVLGLLRDGHDVGLCSNAGYPGISDPGYPAMRQALAEGYEVDVIPGASALPLALLSSGLPTSSFTFKGFPPRRSGRRKTFLRDEADRPHSLIMYESPYRVGKLLKDAHDVLGDREAAVCIELTKLHQRVHRGYLTDLIRELGDTRIKGEVTVVIAGNHPKFRRQEPA